MVFHHKSYLPLIFQVRNGHQRHIISHPMKQFIMQLSTIRNRNSDKEAFCQTTVPSTTLAPQEAQPPCVANAPVQNLLDPCDKYANSTGFCSVPNSACLATADDSTWRCRCLPGYYRKGQDVCEKIPKNIFEDGRKQAIRISISTAAAVGDTVLSLNTSHQLMPCTVATHMLPSSGIPFRSQNGSDCNSVDISLSSKLSEERSYSFVLVVEMLDEDNFAVSTDVVFITIDVTHVTSHSEGLKFIVDGTFSDTLVFSIDSNFYSNDEELQVAPEEFFKVSKSSIFTSTKISLTDLDSRNRYLSGSIDVQALAAKDGKTRVISERNVLVIRNTPTYEIEESNKPGDMIAILEYSSGCFVNSSNFPSEKFALNVNTGNTTLVVGTKPPDFEKNEINYNFILNIVCGPQFVPVSVSINVRDSNDVPPDFLSPRFTFDLNPSSTPDVFVGQVLAIDRDQNSELTYSFDNQTVSDHFHIDPKSGIIRTSKSTSDIPLFNSQGEAVLQSVAVTDGLHRTFATVYVTLKPNPQRNLKLRFNATFEENKPQGTQVYNILRQNYTNYKFSSEEAAKGDFILDLATGVVRTARTFDYEAQPREWVYTLLATDQTDAACSLIVYGEITIRITDRNDNAPKFSQDEYTFTVTENAPVNTFIGVLSATDNDTNSMLTFRLSDANVTINISSGAIRTSTTLDRETQSVILLTATVSDGVFQSTCRVTVTVLDANDNAPVFVPSLYSIRVPESTPKFNRVARVQASDQDEGRNGQIFYSLASSTDVITIEPESGDVQVTRELDYEKDQRQYSVVIQAVDFGQPALTGSATIELTLVNVNDNAPIFDVDSLQTSVRENFPCGSRSFHQIRATDADGDSLTFSGSGTIGGVRFSVNASGYVDCDGSLDYETFNEKRSLTVYVTDSDPPGSHTATATLEITVQDENDNKPVFFSLQNRQTVLTSEFNANQNLFVVVASDADSGDNGKIVYSLNSGTFLKYCRISSDLGVVQPETSSLPSPGSYTLQVTARDRGTPVQTTSIDIIVTVREITAQNLRFTNKSIRAALTENAAPGTHVMKESLAAYVRSSGVQYTLNLLNASWFELTTDNHIATKQPLDRETMSVHTFIAQVKDNNDANNIDFAMITLEVLDVNDNNPTFVPFPGTSFSGQNKEYIVIVMENYITKAGYNETAQFVVTDADAGLNSEIRYDVTDDDCSGKCIIDSFGYVRFVSPFDYETSRDCSFTIIASDRGSPSRSAQASVSVEVQDVNDNAPEFTIEPAINVYENSNKEFKVAEVGDRDWGKNGDVSVSLITASCPFTARLDKEIVYFRPTSGGTPLDYESVRNYSCQIRATDKGLPALENTTTVTINIQNVNDNPPTFKPPNVAVNLSRNYNVAHVIVGGLEVEDKDMGHVSVSIGGDSKVAEFFFVDKVNDVASIRVAKDLTGLDVDRVDILVLARDFKMTDNDPTFTSTATIAVTFLDENVRPWFEVASDIVNIEEEREYNEDKLLYTVQAKDFNKTVVSCNDCTYHMKNDHQFPQFTLNTTSGEVYLRRGTKVDRETQSSFEILISAKDQGMPPKESLNFNLTINVTDINDHGPYFSSQTLKQPIPQVTPEGASLGNIQFQDLDLGPNAVTKYQVVSVAFSNSSSTLNQATWDFSLYPNDSIAIDDRTGSVRLQYSLDRGYKYDFYIMLSIRGIDNADPTKFELKTFPLQVVFKDSNEFAPTCSDSATTVSKSAAVDEFNFFVDSEDKDQNKPDNEVSFAFLGGNTGSFFDISPQSGRITLKQRLYCTEISDKISLPIQVTDGGLRPKTGTCIIEITVTLGDKEETCVSQVEVEEQVSSINKERKQFLAVMIVFITLLCISLFAIIWLTYKWRYAVKPLPSPGKYSFDENMKGEDKDPEGQQYQTLSTASGVPKEHPYTKTGQGIREMDEQGTTTFTNRIFNGDDNKTPKSGYEALLTLNSSSNSEAKTPALPERNMPAKYTEHKNPAPTQSSGYDSLLNITQPSCNMGGTESSIPK